jgi:hypothetical protein
MQLFKFSALALTTAMYVGCASTGTNSIAVTSTGTTSKISRMPATDVNAPVQTFPVQTYCGWVDNPTPANVSMEDSQGNLLIGVQGAFQAEGDLRVANQYYVNGNYGTGCGCITAEVNLEMGQRIVSKIIDSKQLPLERCQNDKAIKSANRPIKLVHSSGKAYTECVDKEELEIRFDKSAGGRRACVNEKNEYYYLAN